MTDLIKIRGAREHNLKNIDLDIPKFKLVVMTGVSGSGKTTLAIDTLFAEGQRRYVESLSSYARQFLGVLKKPDVTSIDGLSPAIAIDQKTVSHNPRSTVGTITEIYDYLRLLYARIGHPHCPNCNREISSFSIDQIVELITLLKGKVMLFAPIVKDRKGEFTKVFINLKSQGINFVRVDGQIYKTQEDIALIKTNKHSIDALIDRFVFGKEISRETQSRVVASVTTALKMGQGFVIASVVGDASFEFPEYPKKLRDSLFSERFACPVCNISLVKMEPRIFSFNSPHGACPTCQGIGVILNVDPNLLYNPELTILEGGIFPWAKSLQYDSYFKGVLEKLAIDHNFSLAVAIKSILPETIKIILWGEVSRNENGKQFEGLIPNLERRYKETDSDYIRREIEKFMYKKSCPECQGTRLKLESLSVTVDSFNIHQVATMPLGDFLEWVKNLDNSKVLSPKEHYIVKPILREIASRLEFLIHVGLDYLSLSRSSESLAGGESQRIRLASQIGSGLSGVLYILDEPSIGLHPRDQGRLIETLKKLRDLGNSVIVVEHDEQTMLASDYIVDFGPGAGIHGGQVMACGTPTEIIHNAKSLTGKYLAHKIKVKGTFAPPPEFVPKMTTGAITILNCKEHNLKNISVKFPLGKLICVTGVSGSGKSTLVNETLLKQIRFEMGLKNESKPGANSGVLGMEFIDKTISIDQSPIGRTPRSNPATYTGTFDFIRDIFAQTKDAKLKGYDKGAFSFNVKGGRCEACHGEGQIKIAMQFMPDVFVDCDVCAGSRYTREVLDITFKEKNISEVLKMTIEEGISFFANIPQIRNRLQLMFEVGLGYMQIGQPAPTMSGGEAQRVKLASELAKNQTGKTLYMLDEPTTGLHFADLERLIGVLKRFVYLGNTVIVIEHNLDVIKNADYIIDLGPEGGDKGGQIIYEGTVDGILKCPRSHTGQQLQKFLKA